MRWLGLCFLFLLFLLLALASTTTLVRAHEIGQSTRARGLVDLELVVLARQHLLAKLAQPLRPDAWVGAPNQRGARRKQLPWDRMQTLGTRAESSG